MQQRNDMPIFALYTYLYTWMKINGMRISHVIEKCFTRDTFILLFIPVDVTIV